MAPYWLLFFVPAVLALSGSRLRTSRAASAFGWLIVAALLSLMVGLRYKVGGDWGNYERNYFEGLGMSLDEALSGKDPGFQLMEWLSMQVDGGVYLVNFVAAVIFSVGLVAFCRAQPLPWLSLTVAIPYLVIVVAMGYTRQGVAIGFAMLGLVALGQRKNWLFVFWVILGATMHKSAVVLLPLAILATPKRKVWTAMWGGVTVVVMYYVLVAGEIDNFVSNYIEAEYSSDGAAVRVAMNVLPALILIIFRQRLSLPVAERNLWLLMALLALACGAWLPFAASSTAVDRLALYLIPLQMFVFSRLPQLLGRTRNPDGQQMWIPVVVVYYALVLFVWLVFGHWSKYWIPYRSWFFVD